VDEYVTQLLKLQNVAEISDEKARRFAVINGFLPEIKKHVLQQNPQTMEDILKAAKIAEQACKAEGTNDVLMSISRIEEKINTMTVGTNLPAPDSPKLTNSAMDGTQQQKRYDSADFRARSRSPSLNRGSFRSNSSNRKNNTVTWKDDRNPDGNRDNKQFGQKSGQWQNNASKSTYYNRQYSGSDNQQPSKFQYGGGQQRAKFVDDPSRRYSRQGNSQNSGFQGRQRQPAVMTCYRCGRNDHFADKCRRKNTICYNCNKVGHIQTMCMSVRTPTEK
jgi:hypothetical protein